MLDIGVSFLITAVNLLILYLLLKKYLFGRVRKFMDARTEKVKKELDEAAVSRDVAEGLKLEYEKLLSSADKEGQLILEEAGQRARAEREEALAAAEAEAAATRRRSAEAADRELARARDQLAGEVASLALAAARRVAEREIGTEDDLREAEAFIRAAGGTRGR